MSQVTAANLGGGVAKRGRYHHGNLRSDLLRVARDEIARNGAHEVTLTSLARLAGVSQPAPYRHFADRKALLEGVAFIGFEEFSAALASAAAACPEGQALRAIALAYVRYGEANTEVYRLMFASRLVPETDARSALARAADNAFDRFHDILVTIHPEASRDDATIIWSQLHGLVMLKADGFIDRPLSVFVEQSSWLSVGRSRTDHQ